jgi:hypothetical protein
MSSDKEEALRKEMDHGAMQTLMNLHREHSAFFAVMLLIWENSKNDPVNVLNSDFDPIRLSISINDPPCVAPLYPPHQIALKSWSLCRVSCHCAILTKNTRKRSQSYKETQRIQ